MKILSNKIKLRIIIIKLIELNKIIIIKNKKINKKNNKKVNSKNFIIFIYEIKISTKFFILN